MSQLSPLEGLFRRYSDFPPEVVIKEVLLTHGLAPAPELSRDSLAIPKMLRLEGGPFRLRRTILRTVVEERSTYLLQTRVEGDGEGEAGSFAVVDRGAGAEIALAWPFPENTPYVRKHFPDGTSYGDVVSPHGEVTVIDHCHFWGPEVECCFCSLNESSRRGGPDPKGKDPQQVAQAVAEVFLHSEWSPRERPVAIRITGGSIVGTVAGLAEDEFYVRYVEAIGDRIGHKIPILLEMFPKPLEVEKRLKREGVDARLSNLEVWDSRLFAAFCPGKERMVGWDEWIRRVLDQVYVYGWNAVLPGLVIGLEMAKPWGFKTVEEAVTSTTQGLRFLAQHGVVPRPIHYRADPLSSLRDTPMPPVELFLEVDRAWYDLFLQYGQDEPISFLLGPGRSRYPDSAAFDMGRGAALKHKEDRAGCPRPEGGKHA